MWLIFQHISFLCDFMESQKGLGWEGLQAKCQHGGLPSTPASCDLLIVFKDYMPWLCKKKAKMFLYLYPNLCCWGLRDKPLLLLAWLHGWVWLVVLRAEWEVAKWSHPSRQRKMPDQYFAACRSFG